MYFIALGGLGFTLGFCTTLLHVIGTCFVLPFLFAGGNCWSETFDTEQSRGAFCSKTYETTLFVVQYVVNTWGRD